MAVRKAFEALPQVGQRSRLGTAAADRVRPVTRRLVRLCCWRGATFGGSARFGRGSGFSRGLSLGRLRSLAVRQAVVGLADGTDAAVLSERVATMAVRQSWLTSGGARRAQGRVDQVGLVGPGQAVPPLLLP
jgi:hypothetical protein